VSGQSTCSLSEALTELAFNDPTPATVVPVAMKNGDWGCSPTAALSRLTKAVQALCDAGYRGDVAIFGRATVFSSEANPDRGQLRPLTKSECEAYRLFVPGYDILWEGKNQGNEGDDSFVAHTRPEGLDGVRVDLADLSRLMATHGGTGTAAITPKGNSAPFTVAEIDAWIGSTSYTGMKVARDAFMKEPRAKGLSATFETQWKAIKKNPVGRPRVR
jgi:hypothetical protein